MRLSISLAIGYASLSAALVPPIERSPSVITQRTCYNSGERWDNTTESALAYAEISCDELLANRAYFSTQVRVSCYNLTDNKNVKFEVRLFDGPRRYLGFDECYEHLRKEIIGCGQGGKSETAHWLFK
jgi:hypothetical protein